MKLNFKSIVRATLQIGGAVATSGAIHGHSLDLLTTSLGVFSMVAGVLWGQVNASQQTLYNRFIKASNNDV